MEEEEEGPGFYTWQFARIMSNDSFLMRYCACILSRNSSLKVIHGQKHVISKFVFIWSEKNLAHGIDATVIN